MTTQPADPHTRLRPTLPTPGRVTLLPAIQSYQAVTRLISTTPASRLLPEAAELPRGIVADGVLAVEGTVAGSTVGMSPTGS
jgi:hypothetical protein